MKGPLWSLRTGYPELSVLTPVEQVDPHERWPSGDSQPIAVIRPEPDELQRRYELVFEEDLDDLDYDVLAAIRLPSGEQVWLMRHANTPSPGTVVYADVGAQPKAARDGVIEVLRLSPEDVLWERAEE